MKTAAAENFITGMVKYFPSFTNILYAGIHQGLEHAPFSLVYILLINHLVVFLHIHTPNVGPNPTIHTYSKALWAS